MNETMVLDGHTGVEHSLPVSNLYKDVVTLFGRSKTGYTPTLIVGYGGLAGEYYWYQHTTSGRIRGCCVMFLATSSIRARAGER